MPPRSRPPAGNNLLHYTTRSKTQSCAPEDGQKLPEKCWADRNINKLRFLWILIFEFFRKSAEKVQVSLKSDRNEVKVTLHEDVYAFCIMSCTVTFRMRNVSGEQFRENQSTLFMFAKHFFPPENRAFYEIMWKNTVDPDRSQMTKLCQCFCPYSFRLRFKKKSCT